MNALVPACCRAMVLLVLVLVLVVMLPVAATAQDAVAGPEAAKDGASNSNFSLVQQFDIRTTSVVLVKVPKASSSTAGGVVRRMAVKNGLSGARDLEWIRKEPGVWANHKPRMYLEEDDLPTLRKPRFILATVRDPIERCLAAVYHFHISRHVHAAKVRGVPLSNEQIAALHDPQNKLYYLRRCGNPMSVELELHKRDTAATTLHAYDLVIPSERLREGCLVMAYMLASSISDVLFLSSKNSTAVHSVAHTPLAQEPETVRTYLKERFWRHNRQDYDLVELTRKRFQTKVSNIPSFAASLQLYNKLLDRVARECAEDTFRDCLWNDNGCGQQCIDRVVATDPDRWRAEAQLHLEPQPAH